MPNRRSRSHSRSALLTPESRMSFSLVQLCIIIGVVSTFVFGIGAVLYNQTTFKDDVISIKSDVKAVAASTGQVNQQQDAKREQMAKDFLASNQKIADKVADLNVQLVKTQDAEQQTNATLLQIRDALGGLSLAAGHPKGR